MFFTRSAPTKNPVDFACMLFLILFHMLKAQSRDDCHDLNWFQPASWFAVRTGSQSEVITICCLFGESCVMDGYGEAAAVAMELEAEASPSRGRSSPVVSGSPSQNSDGSMSSWRLGLKNSIQTNFGDDYVFQIASW